jgi:hypothetical protein
MERMSEKEDAAHKLGRVADALAEDLMALSDTELAVELAEAGIDTKKVADQTRATIARAISSAGKRRLAAARAGASRAAVRGVTNVLLLPLAEKRRIVERFAANDAGLSGKLTLAARKGEAETEADTDSFLRALVDLGVIDPSSGNSK